jgi:hypothetical protein
MNHQQILNEFMERHPHWNVQANVAPLFAGAEKPLSVERLEQAAQRIKSQLALAPEFTEALQTFFAKHPEYACEANTSVLLNLWSGQFVTLAAFEEVAQRTPCPLTVNAEYQAAAQNAKYRQQLINEIANGSMQYKRWVKAQGQMRYFQVSDLEYMTTEELQTIAAEVTEARRVGGLSATELRQHVHANEQQQSAKTEVQIVNPKTGVEYTATELKRLSRDVYRRILCFSNGQSRPGAADRITKILRGQV